MINGIRFKVCGLTRAEDAQAAAQAGADYLGFIFYEPSPRYLSMARFRSLRSQLPDLPKVAVSVNPTAADLELYMAEGFDLVQAHFLPEQFDTAAAWSAQIGRERLWLAPKLAPGTGGDPRWTELGSAVVWDAYKAEAGVFGGTGARSDWAAFARLRESRGDFLWVLAGGLSPENAAQAIAETGAGVLDFNSALESAPGVKDQKRIRAVKECLQAI